MIGIYRHPYVSIMGADELGQSLTLCIFILVCQSSQEINRAFMILRHDVLSDALNRTMP